MVNSAYQPFQPARAPGGKPETTPKYRLLVHRKFANHWAQIADKVGSQQAKQFWDHVTMTPGRTSPIASITILRGKAGRPIGDGWSRTHHYELTGAARIDYQYHDNYRTSADGDPHRVVAVRTVSYGSH